MVLPLKSTSDCDREEFYGFLGFPDQNMEKVQNGSEYKWAGKYISDTYCKETEEREKHKRNEPKKNNMADKMSWVSDPKVWEETKGVGRRQRLECEDQRRESEWDRRTTS